MLRIAMQPTSATTIANFRQGLIAHVLHRWVPWRRRWRRRWRRKSSGKPVNRVYSDPSVIRWDERAPGPVDGCGDDDADDRDSSSSNDDEAGNDKSDIEDASGLAMASTSASVWPHKGRRLWRFLVDNLKQAISGAVVVYVVDMNE